jgi:DNA-binding response OmpR family regulator
LFLPKPVPLAALMEAFRSLALQPAAALLLDDEVALTENVAEALTAAGHEIITSRTGEEALAQRRRLDAAVVDYHLPDANGIEVARRLRARDPGIRILFISGFVDELRAQLSGDLAGSEMMEKPLAIPDVLAWLERAAKPAP